MDELRNIVRFFSDVTKLIGRTPLVRLSKFVPRDVIVFAKLEMFNPLGSVKDRIGIAMIDSAERDGILGEGGVIVEPTSGNTGIALAFVGACKGYKVILIMPENMSDERRKILKALGAEIILTPAEKGMQGAVEEAERIAREEKAFMPNQFRNPANPEIHKLTTAEEIWSDTEGKIDFFVAGVGTGGTITGVGEILKSRKHVKVIAVEPEESPVLSGGSPGQHGIQGIGPGFVPDVLNMKIIDEIIRVKTEEAKEMARKLAKEEGLFVGISSGAAYVAAIEVSKRGEAKGKVIVTVFPDTAERYLSILW